MERAGEWDRRKLYLTRCLFGDLPLLWPISERREPVSPDREDSPHCALPDLVIEKERSRHDEPEEFYQRLEERMLKLYRKLFLCQHEERSVATVGSASWSGRTELVEGENNSRDSVEGSDEMSMEVTPSRDEDEGSEGSRHEVVTTEAIIHDEGERHRVTCRVLSQTPEPAGQRSSGCKLVQQIIEDWDEQTSDHQSFSTQDAPLRAPASPILVSRLSILDQNIERLVARQAGTRRYSQSDSPEFGAYDFSPIEVMRGKFNENNSEGSIELRRSGKTSIEPEIVTNIKTKLPSTIQQLSLNEGMVSDACSDGESGISHATDLLNNALGDVTNISSAAAPCRKRSRHEGLNVSEGPPSKRTKKDIGLQTIEAPYSNVIQPCCEPSPTNLFCGTPMIFNICRCKDHTCQ